MTVNRTLRDKSPQELAERTLAYTSTRLNRPGLIECAIALSDNVNEQIDELVPVVESRGVRFDCTAGCAYCCTLRVEASAPDIFRIARHLRTREDLPDLIEKLALYAERARGLRPEDHYETCVFLENSRCSIYEKRPASCRKYLSTSVDACRELDAPVPENEEMRFKSDAMLQGFSEALRRAGVSGNLYELGQSLLVALTESDAEIRWGNGELVFPALP